MQIMKKPSNCACSKADIVLGSGRYSKGSLVLSLIFWGFFNNTLYARTEKT